MWYFFPVNIECNNHSLLLTDWYPQVQMITLASIQVFCFINHLLKWQNCWKINQQCCWLVAIIDIPRKPIQIEHESGGYSRPSIALCCHSLPPCPASTLNYTLFFTWGLVRMCVRNSSSISGASLMPGMLKIEATGEKKEKTKFFSR